MGVAKPHGFWNFSKKDRCLFRVVKNNLTTFGPLEKSPSASHHGKNPSDVHVSLYSSLLCSFRSVATQVFWMSSHFSESRDPSYVGSALCPECPTKDWRRKSCLLNSRESGPEGQKDQVEWLYLRPCLVPSWCGANRTTCGCCKPWGVTSLRVAARTTLPEERRHENQWMQLVCIAHVYLVAPWATRLVFQCKLIRASDG